MSNIKDLKFDDKNFNKHTEYGMSLLEKSLKENGAGRSILIDKDNNIIAGNGIIEAAGQAGLEKVKIVETTGNEIIAVKRTDLILDSKKGREMALADNATASANLEWDKDTLTEEWSDEELKSWGVDIPKPKTYEDGALGKDFIMIPTTVLDATKPTWIARKKIWKTIVQSEKGRRENLLGYSNTICRGNGTSVFDPVLCEMIYRWFGIPGGSIFDPFCGGSVRGIVAGAMGYSYYGNDLRQEQVDENEKQLETASKILDIKRPIWSVGDSLEMDVVMSNYQEKEFDLIFSCPPYADLEVYSDDPKDISNMEYEQFIEVYKEIIRKSVAHLKPNRFAVWVVGEIRKKDGGFQHFVEDSIKAFEDAGMKYYNHAVLVSGAGGAGLRVRGHMKNRKLVHCHQDVLVFKNGETPEILEPIKLEKVLEEIDKERELADRYEDVLVFTNADDIKELRKSFAEIGGKK